MTLKTGANAHKLDGTDDSRCTFWVKTYFRLHEVCLVLMDKTVEREYSRVSYQVIDPPNSFTDPVWTVEDVAAYLNLQPETVRSMAYRGVLPALKIGKVWRFQRNAVDDMLLAVE